MLQLGPLDMIGRDGGLAVDRLVLHTSPKCLTLGSESWRRRRVIGELVVFEQVTAASRS